MTYDEKLDILAEAVENGASREDWEDLVDELELDIHPDTLRKAWSVSPYSGFRVMQHYKEKMASGYCSDEEIKKMEDAKWELYKERTRLQDARRELNKSYREEARFENLKEILLDRIEELPSMNFYHNDCIESHKEAVLLLSDWHAGLSVDNSKNIFNMEICKERVEQLTSKTIRICQKENIDKLIVLIGGDMINGTIHTGLRVEQEEDVIQQIVDVSEILSQMLIEMNKYNIQLDVYSVFGNHSRIISSKHDSLNRENFERMIPFYIKNRTGIPVHDSHGEDFIEFKVKDKRCVLSHGDKDSFNNLTINYTRLLGYTPDEIFIGHTHAYHEFDDCGTELIVNGSLIGSDDYAVSLRKVTKPCQIMRVYEDDVATYKLHLD